MSKKQNQKQATRLDDQVDNLQSEISDVLNQIEQHRKTLSTLHAKISSLKQSFDTSIQGKHGKPSAATATGELDALFEDLLRLDGIDSINTNSSIPNQNNSTMLESLNPSTQKKIAQPCASLRDTILSNVTEAVTTNVLNHLKRKHADNPDIQTVLENDPEFLKSFRLDIHNKVSYRLDNNETVLNSIHTAQRLMARAIITKNIASHPIYLEHYSDNANEMKEASELYFKLVHKLVQELQLNLMHSAPGQKYF